MFKRLKNLGGCRRKKNAITAAPDSTFLRDLTAMAKPGNARLERIKNMDMLVAPESRDTPVIVT